MWHTSFFSLPCTLSFVLVAAAGFASFLGFGCFGSTYGIPNLSARFLRLSASSSSLAGAAVGVSAEVTGAGVEESVVVAVATLKADPIWLTLAAEAEASVCSSSGLGMDEWRGNRHQLSKRTVLEQARAARLSVAREKEKDLFTRSSPDLHETSCVPAVQTGRLSQAVFLPARRLHRETR